MTTEGDDPAPAPGPIAPAGDVGAAIEGLRSKAPRLRLAALVLVGVIVAVMLGFALLAPDPTVVAIVSPDGRVCATVDGRSWVSEGPVLPPTTDVTSIEGRWAVTGDQAAQLTTPAGRVIEVRAEVGNPASCVLMDT